MTRIPVSNSRSKGFALVVALFMIVVLAALAMFAVRLNSSQQQSMNLTVLSAQASAMANTGIEYGANQALTNGNCPPSTTQSLNGFTIKITCTGSQHTVLPPPPSTCLANVCGVYELTATATYSSFGQPDYVSRTVWKTVSNVP